MWFTQNKTDGDNAEKVGLKDHLVEDFHVGAGGAVAGSEELFANNSCVQEGGGLCAAMRWGHTLLCLFLCKNCDVPLADGSSEVADGVVRRCWCWR